MHFSATFVLLILLFIQLWYKQTDSKLVGAFVLPHGGVALDPKNFNTTNQTEIFEAWELHNACIKVGQDIQGARPDVVFLSTPHGLADYKNFLLYMNTEASGFGVVDDCLYEPCQYNLSLHLDNQLASRVVSMLGDKRNVSALSGFGPLGNDNEIPLRWGEVIPLLFAGNLKNTRVVILSQPTRRYTDDVSMIPELLKLGEDLFPILEGTTERVAIVISADLAHTHKADGPYGYSNTSQPFDDAIGQWARTLDAESLLLNAAHLVDRALSCGYTGLVMLNGLLSKVSLSSWKPTVYANLHPSYYGMMAASFHRYEVNEPYVG